MRLITSVTCLLILSLKTYAQDFSLELKGDLERVKVIKIIEIKEDRTVVKSLPFTITAPKADDYRWTYPSTVTALEENDGSVLKITSAPKGEVTVSVRTMVIDYEKKITTRKSGSILFNVGDVSPPTPIPPNPDPNPKPVPPPPPVNPAPIPVTGFRVLVIYEATKGAPLLTPKQQSELNGKALADYLNARCVKEDGQPGWTILDKDVPVVTAAKHWRDAAARPRTNVPWIIISDGISSAGSFEGPLPDGGILDLVKRYGETK